MRLWPISARPTGDSLESLLSAGLASAEPTIVNFCDLPVFSSLTWTTEPTWTASVEMSLGVDDLRRAQALLELRDALLEHHLLVLGVVVLGVLRDVAELARLLDALGDLAPAGGLQMLELVLELLEPFRGEDDVSCHGGLVSELRRRQKTPLGAGRRDGAVGNASGAV